MAVTSDKSAPYAPASAVLEMVDRYRSRGLPSPVTADVLGRAGVSESLIPRTLYALQVLDLVDAEGKPTEIFEGLRLAPEMEFKQRLADVVRASYSEVFSFVDPEIDDDTKIRDAFRSYKPFGQQNRMVTLFVGLCAAAGLMPERVSAQKSRSSSNRQRPTPRRLVDPPATPQRSTGARTASAPDHGGSPVPPPLAGLLATLPSEDVGWSKERRDGFMAAFASVLDFCIPIVGTDKRYEKENGGP